MPDSLSSSIIQTLSALKHNALVIDNGGFILFASHHWDDYNQLYGFSFPADRLGLSVLELFREQLADPDGILRLEQVQRDIFDGISLASSTTLDILTVDRGSRIFRLDIFPLITEHTAAGPQAVLTMHEVGPSTAELPVPIQAIRSKKAIHPPKKNHHLVPICAACKSIRSSDEEWITIERFLQTQLSLQFTHDICPDCIRELYPKYAGALKW